MSSTKRVNLALQGGGSHGAFTWGVLDALIEDGRLEVEAVSGTSAGAMNAAILLQGWSQGGGPQRLLGRTRRDVGREPDPAHPARPPAGQLEP
jgi:NTE family protein